MPKTYVIGVGVSRFEKPGRRSDADYPDDVLQAVTKALIDANVNYDDIQFAAAGYCFGKWYFFLFGIYDFSNLIFLRRFDLWPTSALPIGFNADSSGECEQQLLHRLNGALLGQTSGSFWASGVCTGIGLREDVCWVFK